MFLVFRTAVCWLCHVYLCVFLFLQSSELPFWLRRLQAVFVSPNGQPVAASLLNASSHKMQRCSSGWCDRLNGVLSPRPPCLPMADSGPVAPPGRPRTVCVVIADVTPWDGGGGGAATGPALSAAVRVPCRQPAILETCPACPAPPPHHPAAPLSICTEHWIRGMT